MFEHMQRLHPRGAANRGVCVDADGAMLGPECVLVHRAPGGFRSIDRGGAASLQKGLLGPEHDPDWLFRQCGHIADSLGKGEIALAQIYGLRIPVAGLDDAQLRRIALTGFCKTGFNPDEPRLPKGDPHGGEWTTGGGDDADAATATGAVAVDAAIGDTSGGGDDEAGDQGPPPAGPSTTIPGGTASPTPDPYASMEMSPPSLGPGIGAPTALGDQNAAADGDPPPATPTPSESENTAPQDAGEDTQPPIQWTIGIPDEQPDTMQEVNALLRTSAVWLARAIAVLGLADPEVEAAIAAIEAVGWLADYLPKIWSYSDPPKTLEELQNAVGSGWPGYETHHIVEAQLNSENSDRNSLRFANSINSRENLVRVPYWKHVEISAWYSRKNDRYGGQTPRAYSRGKSWDDQYEVGLEALRLFGVLR
jgi:hypothetical protein